MFRNGGAHATLETRRSVNTYASVQDRFSFEKEIEKGGWMHFQYNKRYNIDIYTTRIYVDCRYTSWDLFVDVYLTT